MINVIIAPVISEKSMDNAAKGRYTFRVNSKATKYQIRKAIEEKFKVNVLKISTVTIKGRSIKTGVRRMEVLKNPFKKATVTVKEGQKISIFEAGSEK